MPFFVYNVSTLVVKAGAYGEIPIGPGEARVALSDLVPMKSSDKKVNHHPNPTALVDNPSAGQKVTLAHDAIDTDGDGVPDVVCGSGVVHFSVQLKGKEGYTLPRLGVRVTLRASSGRLSALSVTTDANGQATFNLASCQDTIMMTVSAQAPDYEPADAKIQCRPM